MYRIVYEKQAVKDIKNLKAAGLDKKAKNLIEIIRNNPFQTPPVYEGLVGICRDFIQGELIFSTDWYIRCIRKRLPQMVCYTREP